MLMTLRWLAAMFPIRAAHRARVGDPLETAYRVTPADIDLLMHMNNGRYLSILDAARISYLNRTGLWRQFRSRRWHPVVAAQSITYRRSLTFGARYRVRTTMLGFDERNCYYEQVFHRGDVVHATAIVAIRFLDRHDTSVDPNHILALDANFALPADLPAWITRWESSARSHAAETGVRT